MNSYEFTWFAYPPPPPRVEYQSRKVLSETTLYVRKLLLVQSKKIHFQIITE